MREYPRFTGKNVVCTGKNHNKGVYLMRYHHTFSLFVNDGAVT
ncbi:Hypothetical protein ABZS17D1_00972 [Kosakonia cowanii]